MSLSVLISETSRPSLGWLFEKLAIAVVFIEVAGLAGDELAAAAWTDPSMGWSLQAGLLWLPSEGRLS